jgi:hypothetical protein
LTRYDRRTGESPRHRVRRRAPREEALAARVDAEVARTNADLEVVVLNADSLDEIKRTHGRSFLTPAELVRAALDADPGVLAPRGVGRRTPAARAALPGDQHNRH